MADRSDRPTLKPDIVILDDWQGITNALESFPPPTLTLDEEGDLATNAWVFRGVGNAEFGLVPSIERSAVGAVQSWQELEIEVSKVFKYYANLYLTPSQEDELAWLALMQHYDVPTRLLDFTSSPFVGLYFAARPDGAPSTGQKPKYARVWALDSNAILRGSLRSIGEARRAERERRGRKPGHKVSLNPDDAATDRDVLKNETEMRRRIAEEVLAAKGTFRSELERLGCVCVAMPPSSNPRLASQQGLFLFNGAEGLVFEQSLVTMMGGAGHGRWCKAIDIPVGLLLDIEARLFQMNIHEQSLFPDIAGVAGLIKQKIRLHLSMIV